MFFYCRPACLSLGHIELMWQRIEKLVCVPAYVTSYMLPYHFLPYDEINTITFLIGELWSLETWSSKIVFFLQKSYIFAYAHLWILVRLPLLGAPSWMFTVLGRCSSVKYFIIIPSEKFKYDGNYANGSSRRTKQYIHYTSKFSTQVSYLATEIDFAPSAYNIAHKTTVEKTEINAAFTNPNTHNKALC